MNLESYAQGWKKLPSSEINVKDDVAKMTGFFRPRITILNNNLYTIIDDKEIQQLIVVLKYSLENKNGWEEVGHFEIETEEIDKPL